MSIGPSAGVTVVGHVRHSSGPLVVRLGVRLGADVLVEPNGTEAALLRQASGSAGARILVPRGAVPSDGERDACSMEVPVLGG